MSGPASASAAHSPVRIPRALNSSPTELPNSTSICPITESTVGSVPVASVITVIGAPPVCRGPVLRPVTIQALERRLAIREAVPRAYRKRDQPEGDHMLSTETDLAFESATALTARLRSREISSSRTVAALSRTNRAIQPRG